MKVISTLHVKRKRIFLARLKFHHEGVLDPKHVMTNASQNNIKYKERKKKLKAKFWRCPLAVAKKPNECIL
jgi:hypothetical protein